MAHTCKIFLTAVCLSLLTLSCISNAGFEAEEHNRYGVKLQQQNRLEDAIAAYDEAILLDPQKAAFYRNRGNAYLALGQLQRAIEDYDNAIRLLPQYFKAYNDRGNAFSAVGRLSGPSRTLTRLSGSIPSLPLAMRIVR